MTLLDLNLRRTKERTRTRRELGTAIFFSSLLGGTVIVVAAMVWGTTRDLPPTALFTTDENGSVSLIDTETGEWVYEVPNAALSHDETTLYQTSGDGEDTVVRALDPVNAKELWMQRVPGSLQIRVVSPQGDAVALMSPRSNSGLYVPEPRDMTEIYVAQTDGSPWERYVLEGNYEPEAFSVDTRTLFLLKFLPANNPDHYEVHRLDLDTGAVINDYTPEVGLDTWMKGHARGQVMAPDGRFLYTLYSLDQGEDPIHDPALDDSPNYNAFIHVISLEEEWSFCIFLPGSFGQGNIDAVGLAVAPDGMALAAVDLGTGMLVEIDTAKLEITRRNVIGSYPEVEGPVPMAIAPDMTIYVATGSYVSTLEPENRNYGAGMEAAGSIRSMDMSEDGRFLRVAAPGQIHVIDLSTGEESATVTLGDAAQELVIGPPETPTRFEAYTCAC